MLFDVLNRQLAVALHVAVAICWQACCCLLLDFGRDRYLNLLHNLVSSGCRLFGQCGDVLLALSSHQRQKPSCEYIKFMKAQGPLLQALFPQGSVEVAVAGCLGGFESWV